MIGTDIAHILDIHVVVKGLYRSSSSPCQIMIVVYNHGIHTLVLMQSATDIIATSHM